MHTLSLLVAALVLYGWHLGPTAAAAQQVCLPGTHSETGQQPCAPCPAGTAQPRAAQQDCTPCRPGTYAADDGSVACVPCPDGTQQLRGGADACTTIPAMCPPGSYSADGRMPCSPCPPGRAQAIAGSRMCLRCPAGTVAPEAGQTGCEPPTPDLAETAAVAEIAAAAPAPRANAATEVDEVAAPAPVDRPVDPAPAQPETPAAVAATERSCAPGSYSLDGRAPCLPCPDGYACDRPGTSLAMLRGGTPR